MTHGLTKEKSKEPKHATKIYHGSLREMEERMSKAGAGAFFLYYGKMIIRKLKESGATSPQNAKTLGEAGITGFFEARHVARLRFLGKIKEIVDTNGEKRYYVPSNS